MAVFYLFRGVCRNARTSLVLCQLTCSGGRKEQCCHLLDLCVLHTVTDCEKTPSIRLWRHMTANHLPVRLDDATVFYSTIWERRYITEVPLQGRSLHRPSFTGLIGWKNQRCCLSAYWFCYELQPCTGSLRYDKCLIQVQISMSGSLAAPLIRILGLPPGAINQPLSCCIFLIYLFIHLFKKAAARVSTESGRC